MLAVLPDEVFAAFRFASADFFEQPIGLLLLLVVLYFGEGFNAVLVELVYAFCVLVGDQGSDEVEDALFYEEFVWFA